MPIRPLRHILTLQTALVALLPFAVIGIGVAGWLYPTTRADTELHQQQVAVAVASRVGSYLDAARAVVSGLTLLEMDENLDWHDLQRVLDAQVAAAESLGVIYVAEPDGIVRAVALRGRNEAQRQDLIGIDLSGNPLFAQLVRDNTAVWSDTFLSVVGGGLSVAHAAAGENKVVFAEIRLDRLAEFLGKIGRFGDEEIYLLDRRGNIVADGNGRYTAQQVNLSNLPLVRRGMAGNSLQVGEAIMHDTDMVASFVPISGVGWSVLVAQPVSLAYGTLWGTMGVIGGSLVVALGAGIFLSRRMAGRLAGQFEELATHARQVAEGSDPPQWPQSTVAEFQQLTGDLQKMAETIRRREQEQATLMRNIPGMVYSCENNPKRTLRFVSDGCRQLTGYPAKALLGDAQTSCGDIIHPEDRERVWTELQDALLRHRPFMLQYRIVTAEGATKWVSEHGQGIFSSPGGLQAIEGVITDISDQVRLEEQLRQSQKMDSVGQLAGGVAHDFNNMLTAIIGSTEVIRMELDPHHPLQGVAEIILKAAGKSADLIRKLLVFSRKAPRQLQLLDLHRVIGDALHLLERSIDKRIEISCRFMDAPALIRGDAGQLENALLNMGLNARDAMPDGGTLRISTRHASIDDEQARQMGLGVPPGEYVEVSVADTGTGMPSEVRERIFEPFFTTKQVGKGTGLGLAAVYGTVKEHGGAIIVASEPGDGSTFRMYLPVCAAAGMAAFVGEEVPLPRGKRVLLVDDEEFLRQIGAAILKKIGCAVDLASDGQEALEIYAERWEEFDLVMLDVVMPTVNGRDTFQGMLQINPALSVLFMSGYARDASVADLMGSPAVAGFIQKPYRVEDLRLALARAFSRPERSNSEGVSSAV